MTSEIVHVWCPGCDLAVRVLDDSPCPECHRCYFCGRKAKPNEEHCSCDVSKVSTELESLKARRGIASENVSREKKRAEIRKRLEYRRIVSSAIAASLVLAIAQLLSRSALNLTFWQKCLAGVFSVIVVVALMEFIHRCFKIIENRILQREYPSDSTAMSKTP